MRNFCCINKCRYPSSFLDELSCFTPCSCCCKGEPGPQGETGPQGPQGEQGPFLSSYIEANGNTQSVNSGANVAFNIDEDLIDIVGSDITVDSTGTVFTINRAGLYHVEWNLNLESGTQPILIGLLENGTPSSAASNIALTGNYSSGALIHVTDSEVPYTITLHNFGGAITVADATANSGTAASIRILRFADQPAI